MLGSQARLQAAVCVEGEVAELVQASLAGAGFGPCSANDKDHWQEDWEALVAEGARPALLLIRHSRLEVRSAEKQIAGLSA